MGDYTSNYSLFKPTPNVDSSWGAAINVNWDTIDSTMAALSAANTAAATSVADAGAIYTGTNVEDCLAEVKALADTNTTHSSGDGSDHADVATNTVHSSGDGSDHADVATNTTHSTGDGSDHADVATNTTHSTGNGSDHADVASNTASRHTRSHAITGTSDHTANNWRVFYSDGSGDLQELALGADGTVLTSTGASGAPAFETQTGAINFIIEGGATAISTGIKGDLQIPFACTLTDVTMLADQSGSIVVDVWKDTYANFPPTDADSITASAVPTITTATKSTDSTLTGWTTSITAGDILRFNVDSCTTITRLTIVLEYQK